MKPDNGKVPRKRKRSPLRRVVTKCFNLYNNVVWAIADPLLRSCSKNKRPGRGQGINSVLHISRLSHKPFMISRIMREKGIKSSYLALNADTGWLQYGKKGYDYCIPGRPLMRVFRPWIAVYYFWKVVMRYDVIHFHFNSLFTVDGSELKYLKNAGKIIVFHFRGCDLRQKSINNRMNPDLNCCQECCYPEGSCETLYQKEYLEATKKYGDMLFVTTPDLLDFMPEAEHIPFVAPYGIEFDKIQAIAKNEGVLRVVTSSNHDGVDGTDYLRQAVRRLQKEGRSIELVEVRRIPYEKALSIYKSADLFVGKLRMGYYNNANIECMLMGIPNMSYIREEFLKGIPDCPIIITRPENVYDKLREYIDKPYELKEIGQKGIYFANKYHASHMVVGRMIGRYEKEAESKYEDICQ